MQFSFHVISGFTRCLGEQFGRYQALQIRAPHSINFVPFVVVVVVVVVNVPLSNFFSDLMHSMTLKTLPPTTRSILAPSFTGAVTKLHFFVTCSFCVFILPF